MRHILRFIFRLSVAVGVLLGGAGTIAGVYFYRSVTRDLPDFRTIEQYRPPAVTSVYSSDGTLIAEFFRERRYPVSLKEIPLIVRQAFLASEDAQFYSHPGVDVVSIVRAAIINFQSGKSKQGASTITQQVVKNLLLSPEKRLRRKIKEAILSYRLEKRLSKDDILEIYLNQIFFGNGAYGIKAAAKTYFHKEQLSELTIGEAALLAGLPKAPSHYSPHTQPRRARDRRQYVLGQMLKNRFISRDQFLEASREEIKAFPLSQRNVFAAPHFITDLRVRMQQGWPLIDIDSAGIKIFTSVDLKATKIAERELKAGLRVVDKRRGWRGPIDSIKGKLPTHRDSFIRRYTGRLYHSGDLDNSEPHVALVTGVSRDKISIDLGNEQGVLDMEGSRWGIRRLGAGERRFSAPLNEGLKAGDIIEVTVDKGKFILAQTPKIQGSSVILDPFTGRIVAMIGGYDYGASQFNRTTQSLRQPGSAFKPIVYLAAIDGFGYSPSSIVHDSPRSFRVGDTWWTPHNFDGKYKGAISLQMALELSRNLVSADIVSKIGLSSVIRYAKRLGLSTPLGRNPSLSLGSSEVLPIELARAYGVLVARGVLSDTRLVDKLVDRDGTVIFNADSQPNLPYKQVVDPKSAFILAHMMKGVVDRGTARVVSTLGYPVGGKTGTTNNYMDTWFVGFTPRWVCGVWVGFDEKKKIGEKETGGAISAPIFLNTMKSFLEESERDDREGLQRALEEEAQLFDIGVVPVKSAEPLDFEPPAGVEPRWISRESGQRMKDGTPGAVKEYFVMESTRPVGESGGEQSAAPIDEYFESGQL